MERGTHDPVVVTAHPVAAPAEGQERHKGSTSRSCNAVNIEIHPREWLCRCGAKAQETPVAARRRCEYLRDVGRMKEWWELHESSPPPGWTEYQGWHICPECSKRLTRIVAKGVPQEKR